MRRHTTGLLTAGLTAVLGLLIVPHAASAQAITATPNPPPCNPYPLLPGFTPLCILPPDINSEIARVRREVNTVFGRYMAEWNAMSPVPTYSGNPPILVPNGYDAQRILGGLLNFDQTISPFNNTACAFCQMPYAAFSGPIQSVNLTMIAYPGSYHYRAAKRTAQRYTYSHTFPVLNYNTTQELFFGGNFWDGRATGMKLQAPDAEQAQGPPVDPLKG
jgi:cytochrome c peroxidase